MDVPMKVEQLIFHHSASRRSTTPDEIRMWHVEGNGWSDVGYHWLIDASGKVHVGRDPSVVGAHAPPNEGRLGVCVIGDNTRESEKWNDDQWEALADLVDACLVVWPGIELLGHRDTKETECPGLETAEILRKLGIFGA
jgi:hypothetical protein